MFKLKIMKMVISWPYIIIAINNSIEMNNNTMSNTHVETCLKFMFDTTKQV